MALRRLVAGRALDFEQISKEDYQKISKVSLAFENRWKLLEMDQWKEKVKYILFIKIVAYLAWVCVVVLPNRFQVLSNGMNEKGTAFSQTWQNTLWHMT